MADTQWSKANRAASALQTYSLERHGETYGDEGSEDFWQAIDDFLLDLKHLLFRVDPHETLEELSQKAADAWADEVDELPVGGDEEDEDD